MYSFLLKISLASGIIMLMVSLFSLWRPGKLIGSNLALLGFFATGWILSNALEMHCEIKHNYTYIREVMFTTGICGQLITFGFINFALFGFPPLNYNKKLRIYLILFSLSMASLSWFGVVPELNSNGELTKIVNRSIVAIQGIWFFVGGIFGVTILYKKKKQIYSSLRRTQLNISFWGLTLGLLGGFFAFFIDDTKSGETLRIIKYIAMTTSPLFFLVSMLFSLYFTRSYFYNYSPELKQFINYLDESFIKRINNSLNEIRTGILDIRKNTGAQLSIFIKKDTEEYYYDLFNKSLRFSIPPQCKRKTIIYFEDIDSDPNYSDLLEWMIEHESECIILSQNIMIVFMNREYYNSYLKKSDIELVIKKLPVS